VDAALGLAPGAAQRSFSGISTDSRSVERGALFVALRGERFDGHRFVAMAHERGASGAVVERGAPVPEGMVAFEVDDTLVALGRLARARRWHVTGPVIGVTGTNGKTSTKEMLAHTLGIRWAVHATRVNRNNLVGVPLTILEAPENADSLVVEVGASAPGEVARLRDVIAPTLGVVTNVSAGHLEGFGSMRGIMQEKVSLLVGVEHAVVGGEPADLGDAARRVAPRVTVAGTSGHADVAPTSVTMGGDGRAEIVYRERRVRLAVSGVHQVENAMIALAVADVLGIELDAAVDVLRRVEVPGGRCRVLRSDRLTVIDDTYNANPASLAAALRTAESMAGGRPLVIGLGSMLELGPEETALHAEMAAHVLKSQPALVAVTGAFAPAFDPWRTELGDRLIVSPDADTLGAALAQRLTGGELVLLKASHGVHLECAIPHLIGDETA
jgi:UDP-N-acetylmuramoyl-tripeptide--D-alanyl-D-alanine ligase